VAGPAEVDRPPTMHGPAAGAAKAFSFPPSSFSIPSLAFLRTSALASEKESGQWPFREKKIVNRALVVTSAGCREG
jgi:hypothetical protein